MWNFFFQVKNTQENQIKVMKEEIEKHKNNCENLSTVKSDLEREINSLRSARESSIEEVKRLSGNLSSKDVEMESLKADLTNLSSQLMELKKVIDAQESEAQEWRATSLRQKPDLQDQSPFETNA